MWGEGEEIFDSILEIRATFTKQKHKLLNLINGVSSQAFNFIFSHCLFSYIIICLL